MFPVNVAEFAGFVTRERPVATTQIVKAPYGRSKVDATHIPLGAMCQIPPQCLEASQTTSPEPLQPAMVRGGNHAGVGNRRRRSGWPGRPARDADTNCCTRIPVVTVTVVLPFAPGDLTEAVFLHRLVTEVRMAPRNRRLVDLTWKNLSGVYRCRPMFGQSCMIPLVPKEAVMNATLTIVVEATGNGTRTGTV